MNKLEEAHKAFKQGQLDVAIKLAADALEESPDDPEVHHVLGTAYHANGEINKAVEHLTNAIEQNPAEALYYISVGKVLQGLGEYEQALEHFQIAIKLKADCSEAYDAIGTLLQDNNDPEQALKSHMVAHELEPDNESARENIALCEKKLKEIDSNNDNSKAEGNGYKCAVITPVGPGHEELYNQCWNSVICSYENAKGNFSEIIPIRIDDTEGQLGRSKARNIGVKQAKEQGAEWIFFLDADDIMAESAFASASHYLENYDGIWGQIYSFQHGQESAEPRQNQIPATTSIKDILNTDPFLAIQMGHFVRTDVAIEYPFNEELDTGEDFDYYLRVWESNRCIKIMAPLFLNRRGAHSEGPKSADGVAWRESVTALYDQYSHHSSDKNNTNHNGHHIIVCGYSRAGTTMFYNMLSSSVLDYHFVDREVPAKSVLNTDCNNIVTKRPLDIFELDNIISSNILNKKLSLIIVIRDIRSVLTSHHKSVPNDYFIGYDHQYFINSEKGEVSYSNPGILQIDFAIKNAANKNSFDNILVIKYEDIVNKTEKMQKFLGETLGFRYKGKFSDFYKNDIPEKLQRALNKVSAVDPERITGWKNEEHNQRIRSQFMRCPQLFDILIDYGYEPDRSWFNQYRDTERLTNE